MRCDECSEILPPEVERPEWGGVVLCRPCFALPRTIPRVFVAELDDHPKRGRMQHSRGALPRWVPERWNG